MPQCRVAGEAAALSVVETAGRACSVERPGAGSRSDLRARLERRVGPYHAVGTALAQVGDGVLERGALPHRALDPSAARPALHPLAGGGAVPQDGARAAADVRSTPDGRVPVDGGRVSTITASRQT